jgi:hypothetical protein
LKGPRRLAPGNPYWRFEEFEDLNIPVKDQSTEAANGRLHDDADIGKHVEGWCVHNHPLRSLYLITGTVLLPRGFYIVSGECVQDNGYIIQFRHEQSGTWAEWAFAAEHR